MQIYVPLNSKTSYEQTKSFAHAVARLLEHEHPELVVSDMKKAVRTNKVFVDWSQNDEHKTTISVYSLRARERPTVSTPVTWEEVEQALKKKDAGRLVFEAAEVLARVEKMGDLFEPLLTLKQKLPQLEGLAGGSEENKAEKEHRDETIRATAAEATTPAKKEESRTEHEREASRGQASQVIIPAQYGSTLCGHFRMGVSDMEARFLSGKTGPEKVSQLLRLETECRRSQLHFPPTGQRRRPSRTGSRKRPNIFVSPSRRTRCLRTSSA